MGEGLTASVLLVAASPEPLATELGAQGLTVATTGRGGALEAFVARRPNAVLLEADGASLVPTLRKAGARALVLLGCDDEACVDTALREGVDDFVLRSSGGREVALRLRALLGRLGARATLSWDVARKRFRLGHAELDLSPIETTLLGCLFEHCGFVCSREELNRCLWGGETVHSRTLDNHVMRLREKLGVAGGAIEAVRGVGYRLSRELVLLPLKAT